MARDRVLIFGGHTDTEGPNKLVEMIDLHKECYKSRNGGNWFSLSQQSEGGKSYFNPVVESNKLYLIFGYCDEAPYMEELDFQDYLDFMQGITKNTGINSQRGKERSNSVIVIDESPE